MPKFLEYLSEAQRIIKTTDHILYVTFPLIKDKRLLLKILDEIKKALAYTINAILQYEYIFKKITLYKDAKENFETFTKHSAKRFGLNSEEIESTKKIFEITQLRKQSTMEFPREEKIVILSPNLKQTTINLEETKKFLQITKKIIDKAKTKMSASA